MSLLAVERKGRDFLQSVGFDRKQSSYKKAFAMEAHSYFKVKPAPEPEPSKSNQNPNSNFTVKPEPEL